MKLESVTPVTELKRDAAELIQRAENTRAPIVITQNGKATAVLIDARTYDEDQRAFAILRLALQGEQAISDRGGISHAAHRARLDALLGPKVKTKLKVSKR
jgi:prevent-host-death family protein